MNQRAKQVFISYAREDHAAAVKIFENLSNIPNLDPWLDTEKLLPGDNWQHKILSTIVESKYVIIILSKNSVNKEGFVQREIKMAIEKSLNFPPGEKYLIPVRINECTPEHPEIKNLQWAYLFPDWEQGIKKVIKAISPESFEPRPKPKAVVQLHADIPCFLQDYADRIIISSKLQLVLMNSDKYHEARSPKIEKWMTRNLEKAIQSSFLNLKFADLLIEFDAVERSIKHSVQQEVEKIGYSLKHFILVPNLNPIKLKEKFILEAEHKFATKDAKVNVSLNILVTARIKNLKAIEAFLKPQIDVLYLMKESIVNEIQRALHRIDPERFYMRYLYSPNPNEPSVESELISIVTKNLGEKFGAEVIAVVPKILDTELTERFKTLHGTICPFTIDITTISASQKITYEGTFRIDAVHENGWYTFASRKYELREIKDHLENFVKSKLSTFSEELLLYKNVRHLKELTSFVEHVAKECIVQKFGLIVSIQTFYRKPTEHEVKIAKLIEAIDIGKLNMLLSQITISEIQKGVQAKIIDPYEGRINNLRKRWDELLKIMVLEDSQQEVEHLVREINNILDEVSTH